MIFVTCCAIVGLLLSLIELPKESAALQKQKDNSKELHARISAAIADGHLNESTLGLLGDTCDLDLSPYFEPNWRFPGAFFFVVSVVTTIGCTRFRATRRLRVSR